MRPIRFDVPLDPGEAVEWLRPLYEDDNEAVDLGSLLGSFGTGAAQGGSLGAAAGPYGALIGAVAGGVGSLAQTAKRPVRPARPPSPQPVPIASPLTSAVLPDVILTQVADLVAARVVAALGPILERQKFVAAASVAGRSEPSRVEALSDDVPDEAHPGCWSAGEDEPEDLGEPETPPAWSGSDGDTSPAAEKGD